MKQLAVNIFKFYIFINIHVALSVVSLYLIFNSDVNKDYIAFLFFSTIAGYNFIRFFNFGGNRFFIKRFNASYKYIVFSTIFISSLLSLYYYLQLPHIVQFALIPLFVISFFYNYDFKFAPVLKLRNNGIVKILSVSLVWSGMVTGVPALQRDWNLQTDVFSFLWVFLYVLMLTLSFDQRDLYIDKTDLRTIPQLYRKKLFHIYFLLVLSLLILSYFIFSGKELFTGMLVIVVSAFLGYRSNEYKSFYYTAFWIEALPVFWLIVRLIT